MRNALVIIASFFLLVALIHSSTADTLRWVPADDRKAVDLTQKLKGLDGQQVDLAALKDHVLVLNFWATWCSPCRYEMPQLQNLHKTLAEEGVAAKVIAVSDDPSKAVKAFIEKYSYEFPFLLDPNGELALGTGVMGLPTTLVVDLKGRVALAHMGVYDWGAPDVVDSIRQLSQE